MSAPDPDQVVFSSPTLIVHDRTKRRLVYVDMSSHEITGGTDLGPGEWCGMCVHRSRVSGEVYAAVADFETTALSIFDLGSSRRVRTIDHGHFRGFVSLCMHYPSGTNDALLMVSGLCHHCIHVIDWESGALLRTIGQLGSEPGQLHHPGSIAVWTPRDDPANAQVVVVDSGHYRLQFFRISDGVHISSTVLLDTVIIAHWALSIYMPAGGGDALLVLAGHAIGPIPRVFVWAMASGEYSPHLGGGMLPSMRSNIHGVVVYLPEGEPETNAQVIVNDQMNDRIHVFRLYGGEHLHSIEGVTRPSFMDILYPEEEEGYLLK